MSDGTRSYVAGGDGNDDIRAISTDTDGSHLFGDAGDDILRGGRYNDIIGGGAGDDQMFGGDGADIFRFNGDLYEGDGGSDSDKIYDLDFTEGDILAFTGGYDAGTFVDNGAVFAYAGGSAANIISVEGIVDAVTNSGGKFVATQRGTTDTLILRLTFADGIQEIQISNMWAAYQTALTN
jgi:Ca2+-binding RTX toxin-like protein